METVMKSGENWICVRYDIGKHGGSVTSNLNDNGDWLAPEPIEAAIHAVESLILAHAVAGVDIDDLRYKEGVWTAIDAICNNC